MSVVTEDQLERWASSPSQSEQDRSDNAIRAVRTAISASTNPRFNRLKVFVQGSYRNRVNVRAESDVDIGVVCNDVFIASYPTGLSKSDFGNVGGGYSYAEFKNDLQEALEDHFGKNNVKRGNKAFEVHENSYRVNADVVPLLEYRRYWTGGDYRAGVVLIPDNGKKIINYPEVIFDYWPKTPLHYERGIIKNSNTSRAYKGIVRILKTSAVKMRQDGIKSAENIPGYLCECLAYNVPNDLMSCATWTERLAKALAHICMHTYNDEVCDSWTEVDEIKFLFRNSQPWRRQEAFSFICDVRGYLGFS